MSHARELPAELPMYTLAERVTHGIFFWSYPICAIVLGCGFVFWGQVDKGKAPLFLLLIVLAVANSLHWGRVRYGSWRHAFDTFMAVSTVVTHEVCGILSLPGGRDYSQIRITPFFGEPRPLGYNVLRDLDPHWMQALFVCIVIDLLAASAYLAGWRVHVMCGYPIPDAAVRDGMWCHLTFRFMATFGIVFVYAGDITGLTGAHLAVGMVTLAIGYWLVHLVAWWLLFERSVKLEAPVTREASTGGVPALEVAMVHVQNEQAAPQKDQRGEHGLLFSP